MRRFVASLVSAVVVAWPLAVSAQLDPLNNLTVHGHPQVSVYATPADWPFLSAQLHWTSPTLGDGTVEHMHVECQAPVYAEVSAATISLPCDITLFHVHGGFYFTTGLFGRYGTSSVSMQWDETGTSTAPAQRGDPDGVLKMTGTATVDLTQVLPPHGWGLVEFLSRIVFDNGDTGTLALQVPMYSTRDLGQPETSANGSVSNLLSARSEMYDTLKGTVLGEGYMRLDQIPLAPITSPWTLPADGFQYAGPADLPLGSNEVRLDPDLHHGVPGTLLLHQAGLTSFDNPFTVTIDPQVLGDGAHRLMAFWDQPVLSSAAQENMRTILVVPVTEGAAPPSPCQLDPLQLVSKQFPVDGTSRVLLDVLFNEPVTVDAITATSVTAHNASGCSLTVVK